MAMGRREFLRYGSAFAGMAAVSPELLRGCAGRLRPNILVITADDMRYDHLPYMPQTRALFGDGTEFVACRQNVGLCQPARVGFLTGQFALRNGVYQNNQYMVDATKSVAPWLSDAGYRTAIVGKYPTPFGNRPLSGWTFQRTFTPSTEQTSYGFKVFDGFTESSPPGYQADLRRPKQPRFRQ